MYVCQCSALCATALHLTRSNAYGLHLGLKLTYSQPSVSTDDEPELWIAVGSGTVYTRWTGDVT